MDTEIGPVEYIVLAFPGNRFKGEIVPALAELVENETIRVIDLAFVKKDADGAITTLELDDMDENEAGGLGAYGDVGDLLNEDDLVRAAEALEPNNSAALLVWENTWAAPLSAAIRESNGQLAALVRIPRENVLRAFEATRDEE